MSDISRSSSDRGRVRHSRDSSGIPGGYHYLEREPGPAYFGIGKGTAPPHLRRQWPQHHIDDGVGGGQPEPDPIDIDQIRSHAYAAGRADERMDAREMAENIALAAASLPRSRYHGFPPIIMSGALPSPPGLKEKMEGLGIGSGGLSDKDWVYDSGGRDKMCLLPSSRRSAGGKRQPFDETLDCPRSKGFGEYAVASDAAQRRAREKEASAVMRGMQNDLDDFVTLRDEQMKAREREKAARLREKRRELDEHVKLKDHERTYARGYQPKGGSSRGQDGRPRSWQRRGRRTSEDEYGCLQVDSDSDAPFDRPGNPFMSSSGV